MPKYEYKVVPAPTKGQRARGVKGAEARFANALMTLMNKLGRDGWEYQRTDTLPCEARSGFTGKSTSFQNMLVFRRELEELNNTEQAKTAETTEQAETSEQAAPAELRFRHNEARTAPQTPPPVGGAVPEVEKKLSMPTFIRPAADPARANGTKPAPGVAAE